MGKNVNKIFDFLKSFFVFLLMLLGAFFIYLLVWAYCGLPITHWAMAVIFIPALLSVSGLILWISKTQKDEDRHDAPHWATEQAYKNGYAEGYFDAKNTEEETDK